MFINPYFQYHLWRKIVCRHHALVSWSKKLKDKTFERFMGVGVRETTANKYISDLRKIEEWSKKSVDDFDRSDYDEIVTRLRGNMPKEEWRDPRKPETYGTAVLRGYLYALKGYYRAFNSTDKRLEWFIDAIPKHVQKKDKPVIENPQKFLEDIWKYVPKESENEFIVYRDRMMIIFSYFFSTRRSELPGVMMSDINIDKQTILINDIKGGGGKFEEPVSSKLFWAFLKEYVGVRGRHGDYLFPTLGGDKISLSAVNAAFTIFKPVLKSHGIDTVGLSPHLLRRSRITRVAGRTSTRQGMYMSRHKSVGAYQKYVDSSITEDMRQEMLKDGTVEL
jgi:integrase